MPDALAPHVPMGRQPVSAEVGGQVDAAQGWIIERFILGYREADGADALLEHFLRVVIPCESRWNPLVVSEGGHMGLAQFHPDSWAKAGGGDPFDAYQQGANVARWAAMTDPASQWSCW